MKTSGRSGTKEMIVGALLRLFSSNARMRTGSRRFFTAILLTGLILFTSCAGSNSYPRYEFLGPEYRSYLARLMEEKDFASRFVMMERLTAEIARERGSDDLRSFIHQYSMDQGDDPYMAYYLQILGDHYAGQKPGLSQYYYNRILSEYPDVRRGTSSTHFAALQGLLRQETDPPKRIEYYRQLIREFPEKIDLGLTWYRLAGEYRNDGRFSEYFAALEEFSRYPDTRVPGAPDIHEAVQEQLSFHRNNSKDWTSPSLDTLVDNIKISLYYKQDWRLERHRAKENFFAMSWLQDPSDFNSRPNFNIGTFLNAARSISFSADFTILNEKEAYLKTWGWSYRIPEWYFYFRKVDYPADPEIHGNWEWAGIYFGDTL
ncbi:hypothetical protein [Salinispira pacifica]|nr:hypothetical protein [Salinispira pacifica]